MIFGGHITISIATETVSVWDGRDDPNVYRCPCVNWVIIKTLDAEVYLSGEFVSAVSGEQMGYPIAKGQEVKLTDVNLSTLYIDATGAANLTFIAESKETVPTDGRLV